MHHTLRRCTAAVSCAVLALNIMTIGTVAHAEGAVSYIEIGDNGSYTELYSINESEITEEGWYTRDGGVTFSYYYADGTYATGTAIIGEETYLFTAEGSLKTGWQLVDGSRFYYSPLNGKLSLGWVSYNGKTYYVDAEAGKVTGEAKIDGVYCIFDEFGALISMEENAPGIQYDAPYYAQADERWGGVYIGTKTIAKVGCLTSCMAMMHSYYTGTEITPDVMCKEYLTYNNNSLLWAEVYNLGYQVDTAPSGRSDSENFTALYEYLQTGPVIVGAKNSYGGMHFVLVTGCTKDSAENLTAADFTINDPGFERKSTLDEHFEDYGSWYHFYCK